MFVIDVPARFNSEFVADARPLPGGEPFFWKIVCVKH